MIGCSSDSTTNSEFCLKKIRQSEQVSFVSFCNCFRQKFVNIHVLTCSSDLTPNLESTVPESTNSEQLIILIKINSLCRHFWSIYFDSQTKTYFE